MFERLNFDQNMYMVVDDLLGNDMREIIGLSDYSFSPRMQFGTNVTNFKKNLSHHRKQHWLYINSLELDEKTLQETIGMGFPHAINGGAVTSTGQQTLMHLGFSEKEEFPDTKEDDFVVNLSVVQKVIEYSLTTIFHLDHTITNNFN